MSKILLLSFALFLGTTSAYAEYPKKKILITSFEAYGGSKINSSHHVALEVQRLVRAHPELSQSYDVDVLQLPVQFFQAGNIAINYIRAMPQAPAMVLSLGQLPGLSGGGDSKKPTIHFEQKFFNSSDGSFSGILPGGSPSFSTSLPQRSMICGLNPKDQESVLITETIGGFVCNNTAYLLANHLMGAQVANREASQAISALEIQSKIEIRQIEQQLANDLALEKKRYELELKKQQSIVKPGSQQVVFAVDHSAEIIEKARQRKLSVEDTLSRNTSVFLERARSASPVAIPFGFIHLPTTDEANRNILIDYPARLIAKMIDHAFTKQYSSTKWIEAGKKLDCGYESALLSDPYYNQLDLMRKAKVSKEERLQIEKQMVDFLKNVPAAVEVDRFFESLNKDAPLGALIDKRITLFDVWSNNKKVSQIDAQIDSQNNIRNLIRTEFISAEEQPVSEKMLSYSNLVDRVDLSKKSLGAAAWFMTDSSHYQFLRKVSGGYELNRLRQHSFTFQYSRLIRTPIKKYIREKDKPVVTLNDFEDRIVVQSIEFDLEFQSGSWMVIDRVSRRPFTHVLVDYPETGGTPKALHSIAFN